MVLSHASRHHYGFRLWLNAGSLRWVVFIGLVCVVPELSGAEDVLPGQKPSNTLASLQDRVLEGEQAVKQGDTFLKQGHEMEAADQYLAAHVRFQEVILALYEAALRSSFGGPIYDEDLLMAFGGRVADLRNVNLSKLWVVFDPEDRAFEKGIDGEREALLPHFSTFWSSAAAAPLERLLDTLYPEDHDGERQMEALRGGGLPPSKRWFRLNQTRRSD